MDRRHPDTLSIPAADVEGRLSQLLERVSRREQRVIVERDGAPVAAVIAAHDLVLLQQLEAVRAEGWRVLEEIWARTADLDPDEVERDVAREIAAMRAERRARAATSPA